jgi:site-specific recombinase XerD
MMAKRKNFMTVSLDKGIELYLSTLATEGKSPRYIDWLATRLRYFHNFIKQTYGEEYTLQDLTVEDGRAYMRNLMERDTRYQDHPMIMRKKGKLKIQYIHGCGRAVRSFSSWAYEEGYLDENVMKRLKLPKIPITFPEPLSEEEIQRVLAAALEDTHESLRNFSIMMLFLDTGIRLSELVYLKLSSIDFAIGEMTIFGKGSKERKVPIGLQAKKALLDYLRKGRSDPGNPQDDDCVFLTADGSPITHTAIEKMFQRVRELASVPELHPHTCRHTFSVRYLVHGGDAFSLQKILGHTSLEMTRKYVNLASGDVREKHRRFSPMDNLGFRGKGRGRPKGSRNRDY